MGVAGRLVVMRVGICKGGGGRRGRRIPGGGHTHAAGACGEGGLHLVAFVHVALAPVKHYIALGITQLSSMCSSMQGSQESLWG
jgi:hypothetical protein